MLERSVPLLEINSKSVSYLLEDPFNFRPGVAYTYTATLNTSTTAIKVEIGCEIEDWNNVGGDSGEGGEDGESGENGEGEEDTNEFADLSAVESANCYIVSEAGDYKFKAVLGNSDATAGNVKSVEVLWESFGTDVAPNVGDLVASVSYKNGYIRFSTPETFKEGNAVIAAKNSKGVILWSWHIWMTDKPADQVYYNNAGTMMDRNIGATSATPGDVGALGLLYQWGRKDPFLGSSSINDAVEARSTVTWPELDNIVVTPGLIERNPMTYYGGCYAVNSSWASEKTIYDPCPVGYRVPDGGSASVWAIAEGGSYKYYEYFCANSDSVNNGINFSNVFGDDSVIWYPMTGFRDYEGYLNTTDVSGFYWSASSLGIDSSKGYNLHINMGYGTTYPCEYNSKPYGYAVRCLKETE
jgi:hypothetical protein